MNPSLSCSVEYRWREPVEHTRGAGCEWLHVDFESALVPFYTEVCGFEPTSAGLTRLVADD